MGDMRGDRPHEGPVVEQSSRYAIPRLWYDAERPDDSADAADDGSGARSCQGRGAKARHFSVDSLAETVSPPIVRASPSRAVGLAGVTIDVWCRSGIIRRDCSLKEGSPHMTLNSIRQAGGIVAALVLFCVALASAPSVHAQDK